MTVTGRLDMQQSFMDRLNMSSVVFILGSESELPQLTSRSYFTEIDSVKGEVSSTKPESSSTNDMGITLLEAV